ncbi:uncharacterized protein ATNIH1004_006077 [Aspergillus tanneri]|uniref:Uncharacterized protein n=1 Tax=Aspergillus tanneri TaxID=1220188 RepID=A0A5M9MPP6_9EURO|nr:uncharacterized protein ATNIH1004_006077 [Aspergillus tanneri]KAA8647384.1 hypothetical protein ATNIH1004_006077 [Aspergillus tanneri]
MAGEDWLTTTEITPLRSTPKPTKGALVPDAVQVSLESIYGLPPCGRTKTTRLVPPIHERSPKGHNRPSESPSTVFLTSVDLIFSPLYQLSSRAVSVSSCFDALRIRRLLTQTASPTPDLTAAVRT